MSKVKLLDKHVAELIAAGEVVERPASIVKELVENSIDAGAHAVTVEIRGGGVQFIRVTDDGEGISHEDVPTAFLRHATSKIRSGDDLGSILTLGFRGEALASIAAVSKVELVTRTRGNEMGTLYRIEGGEQTEYDECGCAYGTTIIIRDIFYNTPARMKFLKKDVAEGNAIAGLLDRMAMSHPEISLRFVREGKQVLLTSGDGKLRSAIYSVYGKEFVAGLMPVEYSLNGVSVSGFTSKPAQSRPNTTMQTFYINGRYCRSRTMQAALEEAYKGSIMIGKHPACVLCVEMDCSAVDVNVHPAKLEVRFTNERPVYEAVYYAVKSALSTRDERSQITINQPMPQYTSKSFEQLAAPPKKPAPVQTVLGGGTRPDAPRAPQQSYQTGDKDHSVPGYEVTNEERPAYRVSDSGAADLSGALSEYGFPPPAAVREDTVSYAGHNNTDDSPILPEASPEGGPAQVENAADPFAVQSYRLVGEIFRTYILLEEGEKLVLIDKHAAHERLIYERLKSGKSGREPQLLLEPESITLDKQEYMNVLENRELLMEAGFDVDDFGSGTVLVRSVPAVLTGCDPAEAFLETASELGRRHNPAHSEILDNMLHTMACRAAIKGHDVNSSAELEALVRELMSNPDVRYCPHGRPIFVELTRRELEKSFGRIQ